MNDNVKLLPMSTKASSEDSSIEYGKRFLPPIWVDIQEEIERHIEEIDSKSKIPSSVIISFMQWVSSRNCSRNDLRLTFWTMMRMSPPTLSKNKSTTSHRMSLM